VDEHDNVVLTKKLTRTRLYEFVAQMPVCLIGIEACGGANYWKRVFERCSHTVKMMSPQFVKPYVKSNKNDAIDAALSLGRSLWTPMLSPPHKTPC